MIATSILDNQTTDAIRQALGAASRGLHSEACQIGERALAAGGDVTALNAMLGMLRCQSGQVEAGIGHLRIAHEARPADQKIAINLANALASAGNHQEALDVLTAELADPIGLVSCSSYADFWLKMLRRLSGFHQGLRGGHIRRSDRLRDLEQSRQCPSRRGGFRRQRSGIAPGGRAGTWLSSDPAKPRHRTHPRRRFGSCRSRLRRMAADFTDDPNPFRELHALLKEAGRDKEALAAIEGAIGGRRRNSAYPRARQSLVVHAQLECSRSPISAGAGAGS